MFDQTTARMDSKSCVALVAVGQALQSDLHNYFLVMKRHPMLRLLCPLLFSERSASIKIPTGNQLNFSRDSDSRSSETPRTL